jgi:hypothetical protein
MNEKKGMQRAMGHYLTTLTIQKIISSYPALAPVLWF